MKFSYDFLQSFFRKKLPSPEELAKALMMHSFEVEGVEKVGSDFSIDIDVLPNRAGDCFSHIGIAREIAAVTGMEYKMPGTDVIEKGPEISKQISVEVRNACSRYTLRGIEGVKVKSSPPYLQRRLKSCGIKPINNVVDVANYVMLETGQPLHAFDADKLEGGKIVVRYAKKREKIVTLDEKRYELQESTLVISDELSAIGIAGIKGGIVPEVDKKTERVYLEAANFSPKVIRKGSQELKIRTDASLRFEYGIPAELTLMALDRAAVLIAQTGGGKVMKGAIDHYPKKREEKEVIFSAEDVRKILGVEISLKEVEKILRKLEFKVKRNKSFFYVVSPYFRTDIDIKEDIIEEVGRMYGYENIEPEVPVGEIIPAEKSSFLSSKDVCKKIWNGLGFDETYNYSFINQESAELFNRKILIEMEKPASLEFKYLRPSLVPGLCRNLKENEKNFEKIKMFETGKIFTKKEGSTQEGEMLGAISSVDDFYSLKEKINLFIRKFTYLSPSYEENGENVFMDKRRSAKIFLGKEKIGSFGEVSRTVTKEMKVKSGAAVAEIDLEKLIGFYKETKEYEPILRFPALVRDIAVLVPKKTRCLDVLEKITKEGGKNLREIKLFDVYEGKEIPMEMKNFAFRLFFQSGSKTLSSEEVNKLQKKITKSLEEVKEWKVRK